MTRVTMADYEQHEWQLGRTYLSTGRWEGQNCSYRDSKFRSPHGIVEIYENIGRVHVTSMRFIHNGIEYSRRWPACWGDKTLARLARELVEDVVQ